MAEPGSASLANFVALAHRRRAVLVCCCLCLERFDRRRMRRVFRLVRRAYRTGVIRRL
jgi:hypothetical protein